jgi:hypothetical protein
VVARIKWTFFFVVAVVFFVTIIIIIIIIIIIVIIKIIVVGLAHEWLIVANWVGLVATNRVLFVLSVLPVLVFVPIVEKIIVKVIVEAVFGFAASSTATTLWLSGEIGDEWYSGGGIEW